MKIIFLLFLIAFTFSCRHTPGWELVWEENFDGTELDTAVWSRIPRGKPDWQNTQSFDDRCYEMRDGLLILKGIVNDNLETDPSAYLTGGVWTKEKHSFHRGRIEVRARLHGAKGAWPAIWALGSGMEWPSCGEIDIMEYYRIKGEPHILANAAWGTDWQWNARWNSKAIPFTHFTDKDPAWADKFHIWRMDWDETAIKIYLDDELLNEILLSETVNGTIGKGTNPFRMSQYLLLNLALGGINGGEIDDKGIPMRYEIDYVRVYQK